MIKIFGGIVIVLCSYLIGKIILTDMAIKIKFNEDMIRYFTYLKDQLSTNFCVISEAIIISCNKSDFEYKNDFIYFANTIQKSDTDTFKKAYLDCADNLKDKTIGIINEYASLLDENGVFGAEKATGDMIEKLIVNGDKEKNKFNSDKKLITNLSIFTGIFIVIILI